MAFISWHGVVKSAPLWAGSRGKPLLNLARMLLYIGPFPGGAGEQPVSQ
jgi:hypothetical protein